MSTPAPTSGEHLGEKPSPRPRTDLSGAFGPPNRASGLAGRLARPTRDTTERRSVPVNPPTDAIPTGPAVAIALQEGAAAPAMDAPQAASPSAPARDTEPAATPADAAAAPVTNSPKGRTKKASTTRAKTAAAPAKANGEGAVVSSIVYVPGDVLERLRRTRAASGLTYTQLVLDALDGTHAVLADLVAKATEPAARPAGSLFSGPSSAPATINPKVQITLRPRSSDAAVIDRLAADLGTSRSLLVSLALQAHLPRD